MGTSDSQSRSGSPHDETTREKHRVKILLSVVVTLIGIVLLIFMVTVEGEPGAIPLLLITLGVGWYLFIRVRTRGQHR